MLTGVVSFIVGLAASSTLIQVFSFFLCGSSFAYVFKTFREKKSTPEAEHPLGQLLITPEEQSTTMKKLVFDDFQSEGKNFKVKVVEEVGAKVPVSYAPRVETAARSIEYQFKLADFFDTEEELTTREIGPRSEFNTLMKKVLTVIKGTFFAHTVALFWINREKNQLVLEGYVSDSEKFTNHRRRELGNDLLSQVAFSGQPRILNRLNTAAQTEMLGYYDGIEPIKSFVGVPVFYPKTAPKVQDPVAVLALDSLAEDAYGAETLSQVGQFTKLISSLIKSYTDKYDLLLDSEMLRSMSRMREQLKLDFGLFNIVRSLAEETSRLVTWDYVTVVLYDEGRKTWLTQYVMNRMNDPYVAVSQEIDPQHSLVGSVIQSGVAKIVDSLEDAKVPRFYKPERVDSKGSLMILPINSFSRCYGALVVESKDLKTYSETDARFMQPLVEMSAWTLEILSLTDVVNNYVLMDETTGVAARKYFMSRVHEEVQRVNDFGTDLALVMTSIDSMNEHLHRYGKEGFEFVLQNVGRMIKSFVRPYDLVGRYDFNQFAVLLVNTTANQAYLWAEKVRKNIASNIINLDKKSFSVTISAGVCGAGSEPSDVAMLENASHVLRKGVEAGGNIVRVF